MRKSVVLSLAILSMFLFVTATSNPASATTYAVGVKVGDTADYAVKMWPEENITSAHIYVYGIVGTVVTLNMTYHYKNGTNTKPYQINGDVLNGVGSVWYYLLARNLTKNDAIYSGSDTKINDTIQMEAAGAMRTVNYLNFTGFWSHYVMYHDKTTGLLVKGKWNILWFYTNMNLTSTTLWSPGLSMTTILLIGGVGIIVVVAAAVLLRGRGRKRRR